ncbi:ATP-binding protein [Desulfovibrio desulfuricans]|uniref:ATP-binding protein n=1 Tax=Desulfovibrio desulfuricans TaxID=876 RepID=UPI0039840135
MTGSYKRPSPDALLAQLQQAAPGGKPLAGEAGAIVRPSPRGLLKIFFGYAAGVGKTYSMLRAAHAAQEQGHSIVVGYVEPHPRPETAALLPGLEAVPPLRIEHRGITLNELDVDAVLARKPGIALVDELAHSNTQGCRNLKRFQDVEELLQAGISVWTTVNVQHLESLNDVVAAMTGVVVRERIPDSVFDGADQVELVDLEPDELVSRLREGKIYAEAQAQRALGHFFLPANLIALREIALRRMADRVNRRASAAARGQEAGRQIKEHILICLSGAPSNARVIRTAARMVEAFRADFTALFVQNTAPRRSDAKSRDTLRSNLKLAEDLGAVIVTLHGEDVPAQIAEYARMSGVSKIVVGRSPAGGWLFRKGKTLVERLAELAPEMETYIIPDAAPVGRAPEHTGPLFAALRALRGTAPRSWRQWCATTAIMAVCSVAGLLIFSLGMPNGGIAGLYMLGVLGVSILTTGPWYGVAASVAGVGLFDFLFVEPRFSFTVYDTEYVGLFCAMLLVSAATSAITGRARMQARQSAVRALHTELLLGNSRRLQKAKDEAAILQETARQLGTLLGCETTLYSVRQGLLETRPVFSYPADKMQGSGSPRIASRHSKSTPKDELGVAQWVAKNNRPAGAGTDSLPGSRHSFIPISSQSAVLAVAELHVLPGRTTPLADANSKNLVLALAGECALALEKERLTQANASIAVRAQQEKLRADVLRSISHDLRTPLTGICGNAAILAEQGGSGSPERNMALATVIEEEARYLVGMVENLLALTRLEQQDFTLRLEPELLEDVIAEAVQITSRRAAHHDLRAEMPESLLMARMDARLMVQVLVNLLDNAVKHTPEGTAIRIRARADGPWVRLEVADNGPGISKAEQNRIFGMFHSAAIKKGDGRRGMGLGLALCRSIVQAHGGSIEVFDNTPQGAVFSMILPRETEDFTLPS